MLPLNKLAEIAEDAVSDFFDDDAFEDFQGCSDIEKIQFQYCHSDCDDFAFSLHCVTGFPIVHVTCSKGLLHRLVEAPDGKFLDVMGWIHLKT